MDEVRIKRLLVIGIIGIIYSIFMILTNILGEINILEIIIAISLFICSIIFIAFRNALKREYRKLYNNKKISKK